jgi:hypothetical protein
MADSDQFTLDAPTREQAIGVWIENGTLLALGDETKEEWIRWQEDGEPDYRVEP